VVGIGPVLCDEHVRLEAPDRGDDHLGDRAQVRLVAGERRQRHVERGAEALARAPFPEASGAGEQVAAALVHGAGEHTGVLVEDPLDAVAVVGVDVDEGDALGAGLEQGADRDRDVVVDAEARRAVGQRVVEAGGRAERLQDLARPDEPRACERRSAYRGGRLVHSRPRRRVAARREPPLGALPGRREIGLRAVAADGVDGGPRMDGEQVVDGRRGRVHLQHPGVVEQAVGADQVDAELAPQRPLRVVARVVGLQVRAVDERRGDAHRGAPPSRRTTSASGRRCARRIQSATGRRAGSRAVRG
jgi:hypothetical protein